MACPFPLCCTIDFWVGVGGWGGLGLVGMGVGVVTRIGAETDLRFQSPHIPSKIECQILNPVAPSPLHWQLSVAEGHRLPYLFYKHQSVAVQSSYCPPTCIGWACYDLLNIRKPWVAHSYVTSVILNISDRSTRIGPPPQISSRWCG